MTNEIENIIDLFDELYVFDTKEELATKVSADVVAEPIDAASVPKVEGVNSTVTEIEPAVETSVSTLQNDSFVETQPELTAPQNEPIVQIPLNYSGANKRLIAIIYNDIINDSRENVEMLSNLITKALKFSMDDVAVVRLSKNQNHTIEEIITQLQSKHAIVWGAPQGFAHQTIHQVNQINQTRLLVTDFVHQYHNNNDYKVQLWTAIQSLFAY